MTIQTDILTTLNNFSGLSALVSSRNYAVNLPQNPIYPNTVFMRISSNPSNSLTGRNKLSNARYQFDIRDNTYNASLLTATQLILALESSSLFDAIYLTDNDIPKEIQTETYRVSIDFSIWFYEN